MPGKGPGDRLRARDFAPVREDGMARAGTHAADGFLTAFPHRRKSAEKRGPDSIRSPTNRPDHSGGGCNCLRTKNLTDYRPFVPGRAKPLGVDSGPRDFPRNRGFRQVVHTCIRGPDGPVPHTRPTRHGGPARDSTGGRRRLRPSPKPGTPVPGGQGVRRRCVGGRMVTCPPPNSKEAEPDFTESADGPSTRI